MAIFIIFYERTIAELSIFLIDVDHQYYQALTLGQLFTQMLGIFMFLARILFDPYLYDTIKSDLGYKKERCVYQPLCSFSNSAMNIELVYIILTSIQIIFDDNYEALETSGSNVKMNNRNTEISFEHFEVEESYKLSINQFKSLLEKEDEKVEETLFRDSVKLSIVSPSSVSRTS